MNAARPQPPDRPSPEEAEALLAELQRTVAERGRICGADLEVRGPGSRRAWVSLEGGNAWLAVTELGAIMAQGLFDATDLLEALGETPSFDDLQTIVGSAAAEHEGSLPAPNSSIE